MTHCEPMDAAELPQSDDDEPDSLTVEISDERSGIDRQKFAIDEKIIVDAVTMAARDQGYFAGCVGILIADDDEIHRINREHLDHDYPTDVISFAYAADEHTGWIEGELVVSGDTAKRESESRNIAAVDELLLYVIHGALHIGGLDDTDDASRREMRAAERRVLISCGYDAGQADRIVGTV